MLDRRWTKVRRDLWLHKSRTLLVVAAIVVGIVGAGAVLDTWSLLRRVTRDGFLATNPVSATLRVDSVDSVLLQRVRALPGVRAATARRTVVARVMTPGGARTAMLIAGSDLAASNVGRITSLRGEWPPRDGAVVLENSSVEFSGILNGDSAIVQVDGQASQTLPVVGVARDPGLAPGWMEHVVYGFVTPATLESLGAPSTLNELRVLVSGDAADREATRRVALQAKTVAEDLGHRVFEVDVPVPGRHIHAAQMDSLLFTQGAFGILSLLLSALLVVNLISAMLAGQTREIGVMKTIGARPGQLAAMYLVLSLVLGLIASAVAIPVAAFIGRGYAAFSADLLNFDVSGYAIPRWAFGVQLAVGTLLPVLAAAVPVLRGCRIPVNEALRDVGGSTPRADGATFNHTERLWTGRIPRPMLLSVRNAFRRRVRMTLTLLTLATGGAVYLGALGLRASIRESVEVLYTEVMRFDIALRFSSPHAVDSLEQAVSRVAGVAGAEAWGGARGALRNADGMVAPSFAITALPFDTRLVSYPVVRGRWLAAGDAAPGARAIVVNARLLDGEPSMVPGRTVSILVNGAPTTWHVVGVVESGQSPSAFVTREAFAVATGGPGVRGVMVAATARSTAEQSELLQRLRDTLDRDGFDVANASLLQATRPAVEDHLLMVAGFLLVMSQLSIVVGGLGLASTMSLAVLERTREIGIMRAIGATHRTIFTLVQAESLVVGLASWLLAIPLSIPVRVLLGQAFGRIMMPVPLRFAPEPGSVLLWLGLVVVVTLAASAWPARRATRVTTSAALAYE